MIDVPLSQVTRRARAARPSVPEALPEMRLLRPREGHPDWPSLARRARARAAELLPLLEERDPRELALRRLKSAATAARGFVENARRARQGREDLLPLYFIWTVHRACNFHCAYCDDHRGHKYPDLPEDGTLGTTDAIRLLRVMRTRAPSVYFAGGEPTTRPDLPVLTREARRLGYHPIIVNTNGSALAKQLSLPAWRGFLADVDIVVVSLDGLDLEMLAETWEYERPEEVIETVLMLRELSRPLGFKLAVNTVILPGRTEHAAEVLDLASDLGIWFSPVPMNAGPRIAGGLSDEADYRRLVQTILDRKRAGYRINGSLRMNQRLLRSMPLDCRNTLKPHVDADGCLFWPCKASVNVPPTKVRVLDFPDLDALWAHATRLADPRGFHGRGPEQCGADCNWAQNYTTDAYAHGLSHPLSLLGEVAEFLRPS